MRRIVIGRRQLCQAALWASLGLAACSTGGTSQTSSQKSGEIDTSRFIASVIDEPDTVDFQCSTIHYTVALNAFDRLVETKARRDGSVGIDPSLAESWEVSDDGLDYTFHLRKDVTFSDGTPLTSSDVLYTFTRLLTHPKSCNGDIVRDILGASRLEKGETDKLEGFRIIDDLNFVITLEQPFAAFLACLCMPGASILSEKSTKEAGERFGLEPECTIGTGPFVFAKWIPGDRLLLTTNPNYWAGKKVESEGLDLSFAYEPQELGALFDNGELDILNLDSFGDLSEFYLHGDIYQDRLHKAQHVGIDYIALNESIQPLGDVRVRKALQLALNRQTLLDAIYDGAGKVEHGIYPHGLLGFNPDLAAIPYDPAQARELLTQAGVGDGFDLDVCLSSTCTQRQHQMINLAISMWEEVGVRARLSILPDEEFMEKRKAGMIPCFTASWAADYDDPDNFIYTFFGTRENARFRSLCYENEEVMARVRAARSIMDEQVRVAEYRDLERIIVQDEAAWIPLFSKERTFLVSDRIGNFTVGWNGWFETSYKYMSVKRPRGTEGA